MAAFDDMDHKMVQSDDGSYTAYSSHYDEHYHSTKDGALKESLQKHVIPALTLQKHKPSLTILDICFGLGFNTLATLYYMKEQGMNQPVTILSPELDATLVQNLQHFVYPEAFDSLLHIIQAVSQDGCYKDETVEVKVYIGDAREFLTDCTEQFDIVYQDAFSPGANPSLWTTEYFSNIAALMKQDGVLTTYSTAFKTRLALYENGFNVYLNSGEGYRNATLASLGTLEGYEPVDMQHKIACNPGVSALSDHELMDDQ